MLSVFSSGFLESAPDIDAGQEANTPDDASVSDIGTYAQHFDDSDAEDEDMADIDQDIPHDGSDVQDDSTLDGSFRLVSLPDAPVSTSRPMSMSVDDNPEHHGPQTVDENDQEERNIRQKLSHPSTPRARELALEQLDGQSTRSPKPPQPDVIPVTKVEVPGPKKTRVVIRDVAYTTYRAVLYYVRRTTHLCLSTF